MSKLIFEIYKDRKGEYRWRAKAKNGRIANDGYTRRRDCILALWTFVESVASDWREGIDIRMK